jgi:hypothetical protein
VVRRLAGVAGSGEAIRITGNRLSTAVRTFVHPRTARIVTLVGTMHIGEAGYFEELSSLLDGLAAGGAEVHVEGIHDREDRSMRSWERNYLAAAYSWAHPETSGAAAFLGVDSQGDRLRLPADARNVDLSHVELLRRVGRNNYRHLFGPPLADPSASGGGPVMRAVMRFELRHRGTLNRLRLLRGRNRKVQQVVIRDRNRVAFAAAVESLVRRDVVLVWGADHLPGLARLFALQGYHLRREQWLDACQI